MTCFSMDVPTRLKVFGRRIVAVFCSKNSDETILTLHERHLLLLQTWYPIKQGPKLLTKHGMFAGHQGTLDTSERKSAIVHWPSVSTLWTLKQAMRGSKCKSNVM